MSADILSTFDMLFGGGSSEAGHEDHQKDAPAKRAIRAARSRKEALEDSLERARRSEEAKGEIIKAVKRGEAPEVILLTAVAIISDLTGEAAYMDQVRGALLAVSPSGSYTGVVKDELEETRRRRQRLEAVPGNDRQRRQAIEAHKAKEAELMAIIKQGQVIKNSKKQVETY